ncbi:hypothetical protein GO707_02020 [Adlercreutzia equolifaciens]|uniref:Uncharacterized protein n=1 Tax=Adlercreutzia rubneri TaxID=2916441 RepID=A0A7K1T362_9ACTN|nr:hypothetical protein [Adlercreutzia rubneri]
MSAARKGRVAVRRRRVGGRTAANRAGTVRRSGPVPVRHEPHEQQLRRITGYLVGTLDRFNDAKRAEEHDRVKHDVPAAE